MKRGTRFTDHAYAHLSSKLDLDTLGFTPAEKLHLLPFRARVACCFQRQNFNLGRNIGNTQSRKINDVCSSGSSTNASCSRGVIFTNVPLSKGALEFLMQYNSKPGVVMI